MVGFQLSFNFVEYHPPPEATEKLSPCNNRVYKKKNVYKYIIKIIKYNFMSRLGYGNEC